mmetsp:Transcript_17778/g.56315  ORF Transcript_17778/g.56315 Transcript_17778/m.56315 type:complete len:299 (+) Transcript_17778:886-1782(+)
MVRAGHAHRDRFQRPLGLHRHRLQRRGPAQRRRRHLPGGGALVLYLLRGRVVYSLLRLQEEEGLLPGLLVRLRLRPGLLLRAGHVDLHDPLGRHAAEEPDLPGQHRRPEALQAHAAEPHGPPGAHRAGAAGDARGHPGHRRGDPLGLLHALPAGRDPLRLRHRLQVPGVGLAPGAGVLQLRARVHDLAAPGRHPAGVRGQRAEHRRCQRVSRPRLWLLHVCGHHHADELPHRRAGRGRAVRLGRGEGADDRKVREVQPPGAPGEQRRGRGPEPPPLEERVRDDADEPRDREGDAKHGR